MMFEGERSTAPGDDGFAGLIDQRREIGVIGPAGQIELALDHCDGGEPLMRGGAEDGQHDHATGALCGRPRIAETAIGVPVPCALIQPTSAGCTPADARPARIAADMPEPSSRGAVG